MDGFLLHIKRVYFSHLSISHRLIVILSINTIVTIPIIFALILRDNSITQYKTSFAVVIC